MIWFLLIVIQVDALNCSTYICRNLDNNVCATQLSEGSIVINSQLCPDSLHCDFIAVDSWSLSAEVGSVFECQDAEKTSWFYDIMTNVYVDDINFTDIALDELVQRKIEDESRVYVACGERDEKAQYENKGLTKCISDTDCVLLNGNTGTCMCGLDGYSYCRLEFDDSIYQTYWEICDKHNRTIDQEIASLWYWTAFLNVQMKTAPICTLDIFTDFATLSTMNADTSSSEFISISSALLTIVFLSY